MGKYDDLMAQYKKERQSKGVEAMPSPLKGMLSTANEEGKWYSELETIEYPAYSMYVDVAKYIREKYENYLQEGYMFLVKDTSSDLQHIFYQD